MPAALLNGVQLYYESTGSGDTVVLTHGSWGDADGWAPTVAELARKYHVVAWDRRGHSRSQAGTSAGSIVEDVADLAALIEHLGVDRVHSVGNSYGSVIALHLMTRRPDLVRSTAIHEPAALRLLEASSDPDVQALSTSLYRELDVVQSLLESGRDRDAPAHFIDHVAFEPGTWEQMPEESMAALEKNAHTFLDELRDPTYGTLDVRALAKSDIPLLLTVGSESPAFLKAIDHELAAQLPNARRATIQGAGHVPHGTHPQEWSAVLMEFFESVA